MLGHGWGSRRWLHPGISRETQGISRDLLLGTRVRARGSDDVGSVRGMAAPRRARSPAGDRSGGSGGCFRGVGVPRGMRSLGTAGRWGSGPSVPLSCP